MFTMVDYNVILERVFPEDRYRGDTPALLSLDQDNLDATAAATWQERGLRGQLFCTLVAKLDTNF